jgi:Family of unknown function (DUF6152)
MKDVGNRVDPMGRLSSSRLLITIGIEPIVWLQNSDIVDNILWGEREVMISRIRKQCVWICFSILSIAGTASAHHSFAVYDHTRTLNVKGTVTRWQWSNPHAYLDVDVRDASGAIKHYTLEGTSINMLQRVGWRSNMIKAGDEVTVVAAPLLNGDPGGLLLEITLANGERKELPVPAANTFKRTPE